ncbi:ABC transporter permease [Micromonospora sediminicola]|uniref:ABC transporter permease n=1 Tax=Micromonospora sediminicola TaxID=946078 RepID=UPI0033D91D3F
MTATKTESDESQGVFAPSVEALGVVLAPSARPSRPNALTASLIFAGRALLKIKHVPEQLFDVTALPIIMTLMFTYLFGGALAGDTGTYLQFFLPGVMVTSVVMITMYTGLGLNLDIEKGVFDRIRTLPVWRPAALVGMIFGDVLRYAVASVVILLLGLALGFRPSGGVVGVLAGVGLIIAFSFAMSWAWTLIGLTMRSEKSVMSISMLILFPLTFLSNVYVEPSTMPGWLQAFVKANPITHLTSAVRSVMQGAPDGRYVAYTLAWAAGFVAVFGPLTMIKYNRK